jgi:hypothetical protein
MKEFLGWGFGEEKEQSGSGFAGRAVNEGIDLFCFGCEGYESK